MKLLRKYKAWLRLRKVDRLYAVKEYLDAYIEHTDLRVEYDYKSAIGGDWNLIGKLQFEFLQEEGLNTQSTLLDVGMGTLRGGRFFIEYLNEGNYTGFDISPKVVNFAKDFVRKNELSSKEPTLLLNRNKTLDFSFLDRKFDFILAQSVFTHLLEEHIEEAFKNLHKIMHMRSKFYFTILESNKVEIRNKKDIYYPSAFFENLASRYHLNIVDCSSNYDHPKGQKMLMVHLDS